jgi:hypothetical protein
MDLAQNPVRLQRGNPAVIDFKERNYKNVYNIVHFGLLDESCTGGNETNSHGEGPAKAVAVSGHPQLADACVS